MILHYLSIIHLKASNHVFNPSRELTKMANRFELDTTFSLMEGNDDNISLPDHENIAAESSPNRHRSRRDCTPQPRAEANNETQAVPRVNHGISLMDVQRMIDINNQRLTGQIEQLTNLVRTLTRTP